MTLYVKKPIPVEAVQFKANWDELLEFCGSNLQYSHWGFDDYTYEVYDELHSTWIEFKPGDWIIKGIRGEFYPCEESVFAETYEPA